MSAAATRLDPVVSVRGGSLRSPRGALLRELGFDLWAGEVVAFLGPGGTGKTTVLRSLAGQALERGWFRGGAWTVLGRELDALAPGDVALAPQALRGAEPPSPSLDEVLSSSARLVLLDEPRWPAGFDRGPLVERVRRRAEGSAVVFVTHDLALARSISDRVLLFCGGRIEAQEETRRFFESPPSPLVARFVAQGNCCVEATGPVLPSHFYWILDQKLAGMGRPGLLGDADHDLAAIGASGVTLLVSLTEDAPSAATLRLHGIQGRHFPIVDMGVPAIHGVARLCREVERTLESGGAVAVHCHAGLGRTGLVLAAYLAWTGVDPDEAIARVRTRIRGAIQTSAQESFVHRFAAEVGSVPVAR